MPPRKQNYEDMIKKLQLIIEKMENENLSLEEAIKSYEEGVKLTTSLYKILNDAEGKINILSSNGEEEFNMCEE
ncbi:Exodeoxyribonuclease VII small subunit [Clostridium collagenovorans DSM 3089]|uniref:Exodeoxyribonuclease 7 small subunit n=1 Tax=Clostridium collagenovorans DSM 3089 TaxID=1121306 RepID=A0A1M5T4D6_9CLOT|nr:exodeoxyribonuclease VII small subunit [Clostridium collagenovorans]SHH45621.1 Exodeoxyribonuclease VII small subunit [Clostridium collagenovorans DSM 3089]